MTRWLIEYDGAQVEFDDKRLLLGEAQLQKALVGGDCTPVRAERLRLDRDPDAWLAALVIGRWRTGMSKDEALAVDVMKCDLMALTAPTAADEPSTEQAPADEEGPPPTKKAKAA